MSERNENADTKDLNTSNLLREYFREHYHDSDLEISGFEAATSGFSNETRYITVNTTLDGVKTSQDLVVRWGPDAGQGQYDQYDMSFQFNALVALEGAGIKVPHAILLEEDPATLGRPFFVMEKVEGHTLSDYPPGYHGAGYMFDARPDQRSDMWWQALSIMAQVNKADWNDPSFAFLERPESSEAAETATLQRQEALQSVAFGDDLPAVVREASAWLSANRPASGELSVCWGDPRPGNIIWRDHKPVVALDWEGMYIGAAEHDLAWFIAVDETAYRVHHQPRMEGLPSMEETIARYQELIDRELRPMGYYLISQASALCILMALSARASLAKGITGLPADYATNNQSTAMLRDYLDRYAA